MRTEAAHIIHVLQKKWAGWLLFSSVCISGCSGIVIASLVGLVWHTSFILSAVIAVPVAIVCFWYLHRNLTENDVSKYLDKTIPALEESSGLLLKEKHELSLLQQLQANRVSTVLGSDVKRPASIAKRMQLAVILLVIAVASVSFAYFAPINGNNSSSQKARHHAPEKVLPQVDRTIVTIIPPSYTGRKTRQQDRYNITAEEASSLSWSLTTNIAVKEMQLVFNDQSVITMQPLNNSKTEWSAKKIIEQPGFYQLKIDGAVSELYQIEMLRDLPPIITVQSPRPNTLIEPWMPMQSQVQVAVTDDYGISKAFIAATISSGAGEAVKFKQTTIQFPGFSSGANHYQLQRLLDLRGLGMNKGDELYFYVSATDTRGQERKSDMYIVRIEDTAKLLSIDGLANGLDLKVDFFRSQRQIIIETEQLLRDKDTMSVAEFNKKSNNLGIDQKLLRMRYSKFLGEENNAEIGESKAPDPDAGGKTAQFGQGHDINDGKDHSGHDHSSLENQKNKKETQHIGDQSQELLSSVTHSHDNAEDATFFDPETKKKLQATLAEMWKSELSLRTMKPKDALPFEYAALRLLKELQQSSRVYVAKTGVKMPPLKLEKRLTGDLEMITPFSRQETNETGDSETSILRKALGVLEQIKNKEKAEPASAELLKRAGVELSKKAAEEPSVYLAAFEAYRRVLAQQHTSADITLVGRSLQKILAAAQKQPFRTNTHSDMQLSHRYFNHLNRSND